MDEEKRVASLGGVEECPGTCKLTPALHHRSSNQEEARVFSKRGEERDDVKQKVALALRCDDAKMSLVVRKNEKVCAVFIQKASLEHKSLKNMYANYTSGCPLSFATLHGFLAQLV